MPRFCAEMGPVEKGMDLHQQRDHVELLLLAVVELEPAVWTQVHAAQHTYQSNSGTRRQKHRTYNR
jgi:hypothetical protein